MKRPIEVVKDKDILSGKPTLSGTRISVSAVLGQLKVGNGDKSYIKKVYPQLTQEHVDTALEYARKHIR